MASKARNLILVMFSSFMFLMGPSYSDTDTLVQGQKLKYQDQLVSAYGIFQLGFFSKYFREKEEYKYYIGIWYSWSVTRSSEDNLRAVWVANLNNPVYSWSGVANRNTPVYSWPVTRSSEDNLRAVWVANRNTPVYDKSGVLTIGSDGNLKIFCSGRDPIVLTSVQASGNTSATLLDSGNLVLHELNSDGSVKHVLWQSFDYPTDTLLPGMKIGIDLKTGHNWSLTSWTESKSPVPGSFTFGMDPNGTNQLIIWRAGDVYWSSGTFVDGSFNLSHELSYHHYHFSYFSNDNEKYFTYHVTDDTNSFPMIVIDYFGGLLDFTKGLIICRNSVACSPGYRYDPNTRSYGSNCYVQRAPLDVELSVGCVDRPYPVCRKDLSYIKIYQLGSVPGDAFKFDENENLNINDCREKCLRNCSCVAYASTDQDEGTGCKIWSRLELRISAYENRQTVYILESKDKKIVADNKIRLRWLIILVGAAMFISLLSFSFFLMWRKYKDLVSWMLKSETLLLMWRKYKEKGMHFLRSIKKTDTEQDILLAELGIATKHNPNIHGKSSNELQFFNFETIASATNNFAPVNKLGEGGFGPVYKGQLLDGQEVAIKRLSTNSRQGILEFKNEIKVIAKLQHNNLVRLVGCCIEKEEKILIYEYMPNKSLDFFVFDTRNQSVLDWRKRFNIIEGIAQGLLYLHKYSRLKIIHRDLKASNILLDSEMNPKISDFGMAKIFGPEESKANTNRVAGTFGYMSPEYAIEGIFSTKSDVFSFGVLLLEIVSGRRNNCFHHSDGPLNLVVHAWDLWRQGRGAELIDPRIGDTYQNEVLRCIHVGLLCVQASPTDRPAMLDVISMIYNEASQLPPPKQPAFSNRRSMQGIVIEEHQQENGSLNGVSITEMEAR